MHVDFAYKNPSIRLIGFEFRRLFNTLHFSSPFLTFMHVEWTLQSKFLLFKKVKAGGFLLSLQVTPLSEKGYLFFNNSDRLVSQLKTKKYYHLYVDKAYRDFVISLLYIDFLSVIKISY
jgi:hypothetical protein